VGTPLLLLWSLLLTAPIPSLLHPSLQILKTWILISTIDATHYPRNLSQVPVTAFFGSVSRTQSTPALLDTAGDLLSGSNSSSTSGSSTN